jgi:hypothetical protein
MSGQFQIVEGAWLLRPALAETLLAPPDEVTPPSPPPPDEKDEEVEEEGRTDVTPPPGPGPQPPMPPASTYRRVAIGTPVDWQQWYDFYQAVIEPLIEAGAEVDVQVRLVAQGALDADLIDLSVKESVMQLDPRGKVEMEE